MKNKKICGIILFLGIIASIILSLSLVCSQAAEVFYEPFDSISSITSNGGNIIGTVNLASHNCGNYANLSLSSYINYSLANNWPAQGKNVTIEFWVNPDNRSKRGFFDIARLWGTNPNSFGIFSNYYTGVYSEIRNEFASMTQTSRSYFNINQWNHVAVTLSYYNSTCLNMALFLNGNKSTEKAVCGFNPDLTKDMWIGKNYAYNYAYSYLDEFKIFEGTLSSSEISASYNKMISCTNQLPPVIECSKNSDCGASGFTDSPTCSNNDVFQNYITYTCNNPGTTESYCSNSISLNQKQDCGDTTYGDWSANTCDGNSVIQTRTVYSKGCSAGSCFASDSTENQIVQTCALNQICSNGACNSNSGSLKINLETSGYTMWDIGVITLKLTMKDGTVKKLVKYGNQFSSLNGDYVALNHCYGTECSWIKQNQIVLGKYYNSNSASASWEFNLQGINLARVKSAFVIVSWPSYVGKGLHNQRNTGTGIIKVNGNQIRAITTNIARCYPNRDYFAHACTTTSITGNIPVSIILNS